MYSTPLLVVQFRKVLEILVVNTWKKYYPSFWCLFPAWGTNTYLQNSVANSWLGFAAATSRMFSCIPSFNPFAPWCCWGDTFFADFFAPLVSCQIEWCFRIILLHFLAIKICLHINKIDEKSNYSQPGKLSKFWAGTVIKVYFYWSIPIKRTLFCARLRQSLRILSKLPRQ